MGKRFTDTEKWDDPFFDNLDKEGKLLWIYLTDKCNHAGIWKVNFKNMRYHCESNKSDEEIKALFNERIFEFEPGKWFIPNFLKFQYPLGLNSNKPAIVSARELIILNNLTDFVCERLGNDYLIIKDNKKTKDNLKARTKEDFIAEIISLKTPSNADHIRNFVSYWTEKDDSGTMRFQKERFFEIKKRLQSWIQNSKK